MIELVMKTEIHKLKSCAEFADSFSLGADDLVFTIGPIWDKYFAPLGTGARPLLMERFGMSEPTDVMTDAIIAEAHRSGFKRLVAVGGGSVIDIAKAIAASNGKSVDELYADPAAIRRECSFIIVPTTCGTGSEVTNISIINRTRMGTKMGLVAPALFADQAVLIPELLEDCPFKVFAASSIDALIHAVESALSPKATEFTKLLSYRAIEMIITGCKRIAAEGRDARMPLLGDFLTASNFAGLAFGTAGCAAVHAMSYPLGGKYHVPHGESNYAVFTGVMNCYVEIKKDGEIAAMISFLAKLLDCGCSEVWSSLEGLLDQILAKRPLHEYGVTHEDLPQFAEAVMKTQQRLMNNNFVPLDYERVLAIYKKLY